MKKEMYSNLNEKEKNLAKYFETLKINSDLSELSRDELIRIKKEYIPSLNTDKLSDNEIKIKISQKLRNSFIVTDNIKAIENISLRIAYLLYRKHRIPVKLDVLKYQIIKILVNDDTTLRMLKIDKNSINKILSKLIMGSISEKIGIHLDPYKINVSDVERLDNLVDSFKNNEAIKSNLTTNNCIYNLVNVTGTNVKKLAKQM